MGPKLKAKFIFAGIGTAIAVILGIGSLLYSLHQIAKSQDAHSRIRERVSALALIEGDFSRQQTALLEFLRVHDARFYDEFKNSRIRSNNEVKIYEANSPSVSSDLWAHWVQADQQWKNTADQLFISAAPYGTRLDDEAAESKELRKSLSILSDQEQEALAQADLTTRRVLNSVGILTWSVLVFFLLGIALVARLFFREVIHPIELMTETYMRYEGGDPQARVDQTAKREVGILQRGLNSLMSRLENSLVDLEKLRDVKSELTATVSHELKTPLTSIGGYAKLLLTEEAGKINETQREFIEIINASAERLTALVHDFLDAEKIGSGNIQLAKVPTQLESVLSEVCKSLRVLAQEKKLELRLITEPNLPLVLGERARLAQVFSNLISNAIKYTDRGWIEVRAHPAPYGVEVSVRDTGRGISDEEQRRVFERFFRARSGIESGASGTGLGLSIARGLIEAHGGTISVKSILTKGTVFTVSLVRAVAGNDALPTTAINARVQNAHGIWVIDSDSHQVAWIAESLRKVEAKLTGIHLRVHPFGGVNQIPRSTALELLPVMAVIDCGSQSLLIEALREKLGPHVAILATSETVPPSEALARGASVFLQKPLQEHDFEAASLEILKAIYGKALLVTSDIQLARALEFKLNHQFDFETVAKLSDSKLDQKYKLVIVDADELSLEWIRQSQRPVIALFDPAERNLTRMDLEQAGAAEVLYRNDVEAIARSVLSRLEREV